MRRPSGQNCFKTDTPNGKLLALSLARRTIWLFMGRQLSLFGARKARRGTTLGRKPRPERVGFVPHVTRPAHAATFPVHVTLRRVADAPSLRAELVYAVIVRELVAIKAKGLRVIHFSVQPDHLHLM